MAAEMIVGILAYFIPFIVIGSTFLVEVDELMMNNSTTQMRMARSVIFLTGVNCLFVDLHYWLYQKEAFYFRQGEFASKLSQDWHRVLFLGIVLTIAWVMCYCDPDEREKGAWTFVFSVLLITFLFTSSIWGMIAQFC